MMSRTRQAEAALLLLLLPVAACRAPVSEAKAQDGRGATSAPAVEIATVEVAERVVPRTLKLRGTLEANRSSDVAADAAGKVASTHVERGTLVKKGALLARLDVRSAALAAAQAKADRESAETDAKLADDELARTERLVTSGAVGEAELVRARARKEAAVQRVTAAGARAELSAKTVGDGLVRAPFDGLVADRWIDEGEYVRPDQRVVTLLDVATLRLKLFVPEAATSAVREGQDVSFTVASDPSVVHTGKVKYVGPQLHAASRELVVEALVDNEGRSLKPGGFATAHVELGERAVAVVPVSAVKKRGATSRVFVVREGRVEERVCELLDAAPGAADAFVLSGVVKGERVVTAPGDDVSDGLRTK